MTTNQPDPCIACGATDTPTSDGTKPNATINGDRVCFACFYSGMYYQHVNRDLIEACNQHGITLNVWHTGGGCQNFGVDIDERTEVLLGFADTPLTDTLLGACITIDGEYDEHAETWTDDINDRFPPPEQRTTENVARWIADVITDMHTNQPGDDECECEIPFTGMLAECPACHPTT